MPSVTKAAKLWNHNVICSLFLTFFFGFGSGLYQQTVLPGFLLFVGGDNLAIGFAEGLQGIANMISAFPAGWVADKYTRTAVVRFGCILEFLLGGLFIWAVVISAPGSTSSYGLICVALTLQGICDGIVGGPLMALMDDSVPAGARSQINTWQSVVAQLASASGPLLAATLFVNHGDTWAIDTMKKVIVIGTVVTQLGTLSACLMNDKYSLGEESQAVHLQENLLVDKVGGDDAEGGQEEDKKFATGKKTCFGLIGPEHIIYIMFVANLIFAMGAGMTVKFFPVFFQEVGHVSPATLNAVFASLGMFTAIGTILAQRLSLRFGRVQVIVPSFAIGITCTFLIGSLRSYYTNSMVMMPLFVFRCVSMWSVGAIEYSITADYTPKESRARWMALQSIMGASWSGSAMLGGYLIDKYGYGPCFIITACFQGIALPLYVLILPHVAKETDLSEAVARRAEEKMGIHTPLASPGVKRS